MDRRVGVSVSGFNRCIQLNEADLGGAVCEQLQTRAPPSPFMIAFTIP